MDCRYHVKKRKLCMPDCPMRDIFKDEDAFQLLYDKFGGTEVFYKFFVDRTADERLRVAKALQWVSQRWDREPGGPLCAVMGIEAKIQDMLLQGYIVNKDHVFIPPPVDVPFGPEFHDGSWKCLYHQANTKKCNDCILKSVFPCSSNKNIFNRIYEKYKGTAIIPAFFGDGRDLQTRQKVGRSLIWEVQIWLLVDPVDGPRGIFLDYQRTLESLHLPRGISLAHLVDHVQEENGVDLTLRLGIGGLQDEAEAEDAEDLMEVDYQNQGELVGEVALFHLVGGGGLNFLSLGIGSG